MSSPIHSIRFPGESAEYRAARDELLRDEIALRRHTEAVAAKRRALPLGGPLKENYQFHGADPARGDDLGASRPLRLSELFRPGLDTLIIYSYMFGPQMKMPCSSCTSILDGLDGEAPHIRQRVNFAVVAKSPLRRIREFALGRGWRNLSLYSSEGTTYNQDYQGENAKGDQMPALNVFVRTGDGIRHAYATELLFAPNDPGQDGRHVDSVWPLWNMFDYAPDGRGATWNPKLTYDRA
jgi:predicted dithiol-disulfide oxidoreductase (DUF899 family)